MIARMTLPVPSMPRAFLSRHVYSAFLATAALFVSTSATAQAVDVVLHERTLLDDTGFHVVALMPHPSEELTLPDFGMAAPAFLKLFYSWDVEGNESVSALVLSDEQGQTFYIDLNNDEDLTNDGEPLRFPYNQNELVFYFQSNSDPLQRTGRVLQRLPRQALESPERHADFERLMFDEDGHLKSSHMNMWAQVNPGMTGEKYTFFFDERVQVSRGVVDVGGVARAIGVIDYNQDGRFDRVENPEEPRSTDLLLVDQNLDGLLTGQSPVEFYKLNDVFPLGDAHYRVTQVDPYGRSIRLEATESELTEYYATEHAAMIEAAGGNYQSSGEIGADFWDLELATTDGGRIDLAEFQGRNVLLNFWGEWCVPCIAEIPALLEADSAYAASTLAIVGMLKTEDPAAAMELVDERGISWPQVHLDTDLEERFKVWSYPTNILILPDGRHYLRTNGVSRLFFESYVR